MKKNIKKCFALLLAVVMTLTMALAVFAAVPNNTTGGSTTVPITDNTTEGTLTITKAGSYFIYKVFSANQKPGETTYTWEKPESKFEAALKTALNENTLNDKTVEKIVALKSGEKKALAAALANAVENVTPDEKVTVAKTPVTLPLGYYLVVDKGSEGLTKSQPILVAIPQVQGDKWVYDISVTPKSSSTDFTKKIAEGDKLVDTNTKNIGDYVDYRLWADVPTYSEAAYADSGSKLVFNITDKMSTQLDWTEESATSLKVYVINAAETTAIAKITENTGALIDSNYYIVEPATIGQSGQTFKLNFNRSFLETYKGKVVVVAFKAKLNKTAKIGNAKGEDLSGISDVRNWKESDQNYNEKGNPNAADLEYTNEFDANKDSKTNHIKDNVTTFTFKLDVKKIDKVRDDDGSEIGLSGAEFTVYTDSACKNVYKNDIHNSGTGCVLTTADNGEVTGTGFNAGTYYIKETKAPAGYKLYDGVITVKIDASKDKNNGQYTGDFTYKVTFGEDGIVQNNLTLVTVEDEKGLTLPGTGGIGTTLFTFGGIALILIAGVMFIVYTRKQKKQS